MDKSVMKDFAGHLTISKPSYQDNRKVIRIELADKDAGIGFAVATLSLEDFMECITGLGRVPCDVTTRGLDKVGMVYEHQPFTFSIPNSSVSDRVEVATKVAKELTPKGWTPTCYFASQNSFWSADGKDYARCTIERWVEKV